MHGGGPYSLAPTVRESSAFMYSYGRFPAAYAAHQRAMDSTSKLTASLVTVVAAILAAFLYCLLRVR